MSEALLRSARQQDALELRFHQEGDRQAHSLFWIRDGEAVPILRSLEGDDQSVWPPSPPLQQLSIEHRASGDVALLVGMAGKSHWSLSVESLSAGRLRFEAACRLSPADAHQPAHTRWLGSTYVMDAESPLTNSVPESSIVIVETDQWTFRPAAETLDKRGLAVWSYTLGLA